MAVVGKPFAGHPGFVGDEQVVAMPSSVAKSPTLTSAMP